MKVYKISPRLVFLSNDKVYKFFNNSKECEDESDKINSSPFSDYFDSDTKYNMKFVKILHVNKYFYIMQPAKGLCLNDTKNILDYKLAGSWLRIFHNFSYDEQSKKAFLFSDFDIFIATFAKTFLDLLTTLVFGFMTFFFALVVFGICQF